MEKQPKFTKQNTFQDRERLSAYFAEGVNVLSIVNDADLIVGKDTYNVSYVVLSNGMYYIQQIREYVGTDNAYKLGKEVLLSDLTNKGQLYLFDF